MAASIDWVLLAYRLPREPSTTRVGVWRKLRRLGVVQLVDGLVALPADARTREQLEWVAEEVTDAGGEATVWLGRPGSRAQERMLAERMADAARLPLVWLSLGIRASSQGCDMSRSTMVAP